MDKKKRVTLKAGNRGDNKLSLDGREIKVFTHRDPEERKVVWEIKNKYTNPNHSKHVQSFRIVPETDYHPFTADIPTDFRSILEMQLQEEWPEEEWKYTIEWKGTGDLKPRPDDPKISINPSLISGLVAHKAKTVKYGVILIALAGLGLLAQKSSRYRS
jgi:hypothetical protein